MTPSPYQFDWTSVAAGTYAITAKAIDNNGGETTSAPRNVTVAGTNTPPTVSLSGPADNARYLNPTSVTLSATASGPEVNDILQKVEFFLNGSLVGTVTAAPWTFSLPSPTLGAHSLTAVATDSLGAQTTSAARTLVVSDTNAVPTVSIVTPVDNSNWHAPASFMFQASASSGEANDTVTVEFYVNGALQGSDSTSPYSVNLSGLAAGTYTLMAKAIDGQGAQTSSVTRTVTISDTNAAPTISITAPSGGANFPTAPAGFTFSATAGAGESNGWIARVEFYVNGSLVSTDTSGPWSYPVAGLANGTYQLTAKAVDQLGGETTTAPVSITVGPQPKLHFIHVDHLNTPRLVANAAGQTVWTWDQVEPFGANVPNQNPSGIGVFDLPLRLPGQTYDTETGLHYNYYRNYDASIGGYKESDLIGLLGGINTYAYVAASPLSRIDPLGLEWQFTIGIGGSIGGNPFMPILSPFVGGGLSLGFTTSGQIIVQAQATGSVGIGIFGGVGVQGQVSQSNCPTPSGMSVQQALQGDFNFGAGPTVGGSVQYDPLSKGGGFQSGIGRIGKARLGLGAGLQASVGVTQTTTLATPALFPSAPSPQCGCQQ